ncbi:signal peptidase II [Youngiibacter multivorans]|uniref:Lipoprotein signal peptidase n=1 Tax=Youngiibacter multivorans TaxID=937251 RepID=A0ABS4G222_9CLOT|nr:signal peptidase II [Youngiibacter multivorans]MBP1918584.1 signal peptidase II [Youngiibacter multivorans]
MALLIVIIGLVLDRISKAWAIAVLKGSSGITVIEGFFDLAYLENRGAAFGIFQGKAYILAGATTLVILGIIINYFRTKKRTVLFTLSNAMIVAGAVGNLVDRVRQGYVVDFIEWHWKTSYYFPSFNVADMFITVGTALLIIYILKDVD